VDRAPEPNDGATHASAARVIRTGVEAHQLAVDRRIADEVRAILRFWGA
jgi:hypothetical protein